MIQELKGSISRMLLQESVHLRKHFWGRHLWARGAFAVFSGTITEAMMKQYIAEQEGESKANSTLRSLSASVMGRRTDA